MNPEGDLGQEQAGESNGLQGGRRGRPPSVIVDQVAVAGRLKVVNEEIETQASIW